MISEIELDPEQPASAIKASAQEALLPTFIDLARATTAQRGWCPTTRAVAAVLLDAAGVTVDRLSAGVYAVITPTPFVDEDVCDLIAEAIAPRETRSYQDQP